MKKIMVLFLLSSAVAKADNDPSPAPANSSQCTTTFEVSATHKALQETIGLHYDLSQVKASMREIADQLNSKNSTSPSSANPSQEAQAALDVIDRLNDSCSDLQQAISSLDNPENVSLILAQAQGRLTAALTKFRSLKRLDLDEASKTKVLCLEAKVRATNDRLKEILAGMK